MGLVSRHWTHGLDHVLGPEDVSSMLVCACGVSDNASATCRILPHHFFTVVGTPTGHILWCLCRSGSGSVGQPSGI